jgi:hypothetical protein
MSFCVPAFLTRQRFSDPLIHPSAPRRGVERRLRERVMRPHIMQQAVRHKASSHTPPSPLFPTTLEHPNSGMQKVVLWHAKSSAMAICVPAFHTSACFSRPHRIDPLLHPSASRPGVDRLLRLRVMRRPIMQQVVRHKASSRTPPSPLFHA